MPNLARHVVQRILNPRVLNEMASYDAASNICQAAPVRHVVQRSVNPRVLNQMASYDVASNILPGPKRWSMGPRRCSARTSSRQGLTLVNFSAQNEPFLTQ